MLSTSFPRFNNLTLADAMGMCAAIRETDQAGEEDLLQQQLYRLGVFIYRSYWGVGLPSDIDEPGLKSRSLTRDWFLDDFEEEE